MSKDPIQATPTDIARMERGEMPAPRQADMIHVLEKAIANPDIDVEKLERLAALYQSVTAENQRVAFQAALGRITNQIQPVVQSGRGHENRAYSRHEDIDKEIRPLLAAEGMAQSFNTKTLENGKLRFFCTVSHKDGHEKTIEMDLPPDKSGSKNEVQAVLSSAQYARRMLTKMFFNIVEQGDDADNSPITEDQVKYLKSVIDELKMDEGRFLLLMRAGELKDILAKDFRKAMNAIDVKRRDLQEKAGVKK